jgi:hypothetical protein
MNICISWLRCQVLRVEHHNIVFLPTQWPCRSRELMGPDRLTDIDTS